MKRVLLIIIVAFAAVLCFYQLDQIPHGLYIDEVSIGYNAYQILHTGKDEYGVSFPLFFKAFGEYKMPVAVYLTSVSMALFGKTEFAVRFWSAFFGTGTVFVLYFFVKSLFKKNKELVGLVSAFLLAIFPWHIQFSRGGFEANIALFFYLLGGLFFLLSITYKRTFFIFLSCFSFLVTVYTYNSYKLIAPVTLLVCFIFLYKRFIIFRKAIITSAVFFFICFLPILFFSDANNRLLQTSTFSEYSSRSLVQKIAMYPMVYLKNYLTFFSLPFLFVTGDGFGRHTIVGMGSFFRWELPFLFIGFLYLIRMRKEFFAKVVFFLLLIAPTTAAFTLPSPHALRSLLLVIPFTIITAYGLVMLWQRKGKFLKIILGGIFFIALYEFCFYLHFYYLHYPLRTALDWGGEYKQVAEVAYEQQKNYQHIVINNGLSQVSSYMRFYHPELHYLLVDGNWEKPKEWKDKKILYISSNDPKHYASLLKVPHKHILDIRFSNLNNDLFAQFWEI